MSEVQGSGQEKWCTS